MFTKKKKGVHKHMQSQDLNLQHVINFRKEGHTFEILSSQTHSLLVMLLCTTCQ